MTDVTASESQSQQRCPPPTGRFISLSNRFTRVATDRRGRAAWKRPGERPHDHAAARPLRSPSG